MALPMLMGGADCGPTNALQGLSKRFDQDRGLQQDQFGAGRAGSSRDAFRTQHPGIGPDADAARFFSAGNAPSGPQMNMGSPFDLSAMRTSLPMQPQHHQSPAVMQQQQQQQQLSVWAADFLQKGPVQSPVSPQQMHAGSQNAHQGGQNVMQWNPAQTAFRMNSSMQMMRPMGQMQPPQAQKPVIHHDNAMWEAHDWDLGPPVLVKEVSQQEAQTHGPEERDALARTAGMLVESIKDEQNPKFQNSAFLGLMRQLRDKEVVVDGNEMVEASGASWANDFQQNVEGKVDVKGKGPANTPYVLASRTAAQNSPYSYEAMQYSEKMMNPLLDLTKEAEDANDAYFKQDNAEYTKYWSDAATAKPPVAAPGERAEWDQFQSDWDRFEATTSGIKAIHSYQFQSNNPYLLGESSRTRNHDMHSQVPQSFYESVLELEATVQRSPVDASAWFQLGVKQQENEREGKAMQALQRAVELDPTHLPSWLALAISNTNDANRSATYDAVREWVDRNDTYGVRVAAYRQEVGDVNDIVGREAKGRWLIGCLMSMARSSQNGSIDADVQIALGILFNTNEDYNKAQDCFKTALAVRPDDWLLYNRVGATMANSGHAEDALQYYYRALELNPAYIRARYNLGISCINLRRYEEAAQHILDALLLQDSDGVDDTTGMNDKRGVMSDALWDSLKTTCLHLQRVDLATMCDRKSLQELRGAFSGA